MARRGATARAAPPGLHCRRQDLHPPPHKRVVPTHAGCHHCEPPAARSGCRCAAAARARAPRRQCCCLLRSPPLPRRRWRTCPRLAGAPARRWLFTRADVAGGTLLGERAAVASGLINGTYAGTSVGRQAQAYRRQGNGFPQHESTKARAYTPHRALRASASAFGMMSAATARRPGNTSHVCTRRKVREPEASVPRSST